jgi:hypothetical protein
MPKVNGDTLTFHNADENRSKRIQNIPNILNDIHLRLTPKTLPAHPHSSDTYGEEDGKCVWISASPEGTVIKHYNMDHYIYRIQDDL